MVSGLVDRIHQGKSFNETPDTMVSGHIGGLHE